MEHVHGGSGLHGRAADVAAEGQKPTCESCADTAAQLGAEGSTGVHGTVDALAACQVGVLGASRDKSVHITLQRAHTDCGDCSADQHQRHGPEIACDDNAETAQCADGVAHQVELVHPAEFGDQRRREQQADDHRDIDEPGEYAQEVRVFEHISHVVDAHVQGRGINLHQNIGSADHQIILVFDQELEGVDESVLLLLAGGGLNFLAFRELFGRQFFDRHNGERVGDHTDNGVDDRHGTPCSRAAAKICNEADCDRLDQHAGAEGKHEADGAHLDALVVIFGDQGCQRRVRDVVGRIETGVEQRVGDEEPGVLGRRADIRGNAEDRDKADRAPKISIKHPRSCLTHLGVGLVDQGSEEDITDTVKELGDCDKSTDDTGVHTHRVGKEDHDKGGQQGVNYVAGDIARAVSNLVDPVQIGLFFGVFSFVEFFIIAHRFLLLEVHVFA